MLCKTIHNIPSIIVTSNGTVPAFCNDRKDVSHDAEAVTVFTNPRSDKRENMAAAISFDDGKTWACTKTVRAGPAAYSSIVYNPVDHRFYMMYERGEKNAYHHGISVAEFDLEWLLS